MNTAAALGRLARAALRPIEPETRDALQRAWAELPLHVRGPQQFLGRQYVGCGATIGAMPRCDFACRGCYLGEDANRAPALPLSEVKAQLDRLRGWLGHGGNVQLTDGEVALRPPEEVAELVRHAREVGLVPMLMTHGEGIRRDPSLLEGWMRDGGLSEISIHVDTTQRGRRSPEFRAARSEQELDSLRDEFAEIIRSARRRTGLSLEVATTVTVSAENLAGVPGVVRWMTRNADAVKMVSFQPIAAVGRTQEGLRAVTPEALWDHVAAGLEGPNTSSAALLGATGAMGHPDCTRFVQGLVVRRAGGAPGFHPLLDPKRGRDRARLARLLDRIGGLTFRLDDRPRATARAAGLALRHGPALLRDAAPLALELLRRIEPDAPVRLLAELLSGRAEARYLNIVSHHFMSREQLETPRGEERRQLCAFRVPIDGALVSMCEVNALGTRDRFYEKLAVGREAHQA